MSQILDFLLTSGYESSLIATRMDLEANKDVHNAMLLTSNSQNEKAQPKINQPFSDSFLSTTDNNETQKSSLLADCYASQILGIPLPAKEHGLTLLYHQWLNKLALIALAFIVLLLTAFGVYNFPYLQNSEDAQLTFDPTRISHVKQQPASLATLPEQNTPDDKAEETLQHIPRRKVMVVTEGERERLLEDLKNKNVHHPDIETLDTYMNVAPHKGENP